MSSDDPICVECGQLVKPGEGLPTRQGGMIHLACASARATQAQYDRAYRAHWHLALIFLIGFLVWYTLGPGPAGIWLLAGLILCAWMDRLYYKHLFSLFRFRKRR
jgi:hypothetical protein